MGFLFGKFFRAFLVIYVGVFAFNLVEPFPRAFENTPVSVTIDQSAVTFLSDVTYTASSGAQRIEHQIFPEMLQMMAHARHFVFADMFLLNQFEGSLPSLGRDLSGEFTSAMIAAKQRNSSSTVVLVTDPINRAYGGMVSSELDRMASSGVLVVETDLHALRESNLLWGTLYKMFFRWFPNSGERGWLPNPLDHEGPKVTLRTYANLFNFKANHRKVLITDETTAEGTHLSLLVGSLNPHSASAENGNVALKVTNTAIAMGALGGEQAIFRKAGVASIDVPRNVLSDDDGGSGVVATYMTESHIRSTIVRILDELKEGEQVDIAVFYLSERNVIRAIERARDRGVILRILLDPNENAFGKRKFGIPNRQTAERLLRGDHSNLMIRWCNTHGEQCHAKMLLATGGGKSSLLIGSANYTRRNIGKFNLESAILIESGGPVRAISDASKYMERVWGNMKGETSVSVDVYRDRASWKRLIATIMEYTGLSTF